MPCYQHLTDTFSKVKIADLVQIAPEDFGKSSFTAIEDNLNAKYVNKVVQKVGLFISLWDILWTSEGLIGHGTGLVNVNGKCHKTIRNPQSIGMCFNPNCIVEFRMVVFRPFKGEVIVGRIASQSPEGINRSSLQRLISTTLRKLINLTTYTVETDFFHDIFIAGSELPDGSVL